MHSKFQARLNYSSRLFPKADRQTIKYWTPLLSSFVLLSCSGLGMSKKTEFSVLSSAMQAGPGFASDLLSLPLSAEVAGVGYHSSSSSCGFTVIQINMQL